jgi:hypothetical protein
MLMDLTEAVHFTARALEGLRANRLRLVRSVALVIGILLSIASADRLEAQNMPLKSLARNQLTLNQYKCHNSIIDIESNWDINAIGNKSGKKQTYGYYQMKSKSIKGKPYDYQFEVYWYYVAKRYGVTKYDEPNYCNALHHLRAHGWQ